VRIDLPRMLLALRTEEVERRVLRWHERKLEEWAAWVLGHARLYRALTGLARIVQRPLVREGRLRLPRRLNPAQERDLPGLAARSFRSMWDDLQES
jgi:hypothetical protein